MSRELTPLQRTIAAQQKAAVPVASAWVSANAGSGKTRVLTDRVIRLMLAGAEPSQILSITFTKAAAAEMSNRLFERLGEWAALPDAALKEKLVELAGRDVLADIRLDDARRLFARALETPGGLKIQTIHAFAESVLGRFPVEAGISPEFEVLDDARSLGLLDDLKQDLLTGEGLDDAALEALDRLLGQYADSSFQDLLGKAIFARRDIRTALTTYNGVDGTVAAVREALGIGPDDTRQQVVSGGCAQGEWNEIGLRRALEALRGDGGKTAIGRAETISAWLASDDTGRELMLDDYAGAFLTRKGVPAKNICPASVKKTDPAIEDILLTEQERLATIADRMKAATLGDLTRDLLLIADPLLRGYDDAKRRRSLLDYDDQIDITLRLLESQAAWVHYKLDQGISHILIDEAQDTSPQQWRIAERLSDEFFAGDGAREGERTIFAVGDEKQSIYSFQGADPEGFDRMRRHFQDKASEARGVFHPERLELSFRSAPEILTAVDAVFHGSEGDLTASGAEVTHQAWRTEAQGLVELWPMDEPMEKVDPERWKAPLDDIQETSNVRRLARRIAERIRRMIDDGETIRDRRAEGETQRPITPGDVMILVRQRGALVDEIARALKDADIALPVAGADRMQLTSQIAVMDLMVLGDFVLLPEDDLALATVLKSPLYGFTDDDLFDLAWDRGEGVRLWRVLRDRAAERPRWQAALDELRHLMAAADQGTPYGFYSALLSARGGRKRLHARLGADQMDPLDEFLNAALEDERLNTPSLQGFLHRLRQSESEIKRDMEQGMDAVRIMTVHGAKGLEAPVVFLPDTARPPKGSSSGLLTLPGPGDVKLPVIGARKEEAPAALMAEAERKAEADLAEYNRLLYVAMTRAEDRLYVCGYFNSERSRPSDDGWYERVKRGLSGIAEETDDSILRLGRALQDRAPGTGTENPTSLPGWLTAAAPDEPVPTRPLAPSRTEGDHPAQASPLVPATGGAGRKRGVLIHHLLEVLPDLPATEREAVGRASLERRARDLDVAEREAMLGEALAVIGDPAMAQAFGPGSRAEAAISGMVGGIVITGQVDRLAIADGEAWIIDYKTNRPPPAKVQDVAPAYLRQMTLYREVIRQVHPEISVRTALVWTFETRMMVLPDSMLDEALASLDLGQGAT
jgi:ATP-dependent helicase/nuclease subunit A